ncbi:MAG: isocitrate/isopropylmalate dehydrogenase family protein [Ruminococcaceae bacterium]|nr:isocitrate/isopropylmalate dehydrogenase family protein [Oscillospiraceae bacterium]
MEAKIKEATKKFEELLRGQLERAEKMKENKDFTDYNALDKIVIGIVPGDGIGPIILREAERVLRFLLEDKVKSGKVELKNIDGLTIENRVAKLKSIPDDVMDKIKSCHVLLKGPTTTPSKGDGLPNLESANVTMRKELDLFANVRPVKVPEKNIDWTFFRENTEGSYAVGSKGINVTDDVAVDFCIATTEGCERIARAAFEFAKNNGKKRVSAVTKANIIKTTDGKFLDICKEVAKDYPDITLDSWYVDIMTANLINEDIRSSFEVFVLPNLYGDIITDEAAQIQGGVGTAGSSNIGKKYAMFEAIHGSAPRMIEEGIGEYANPSSIFKATEMLLRHIGFINEANKLDEALNKCIEIEKKVVVTGNKDGATTKEFADYVMQTVKAL